MTCDFARRCDGHFVVYPYHGVVATKWKETLRG